MAPSGHGSTVRIPSKTFGFWAIALLQTGTAFAQSGWYRQPPWPTTEHLQGVATPDSSTIVAVGDRGTVVRSTDGGDSWVLQGADTSNNLAAVSFVDANTGTAVGSYGTILRTIDGGETWVSQDSGTDFILLGVAFVDEWTGMAVGSLGRLTSSADGVRTCQLKVCFEIS